MRPVQPTTRAFPALYLHPLPSHPRLLPPPSHFPRFPPVPPPPRRSERTTPTTVHSVLVASGVRSRVYVRVNLGVVPCGGAGFVLRRLRRTWDPRATPRLAHVQEHEASGFGTQEEEKEARNAPRAPGSKEHGPCHRQGAATGGQADVPRRHQERVFGGAREVLGRRGKRRLPPTRRSTALSAELRDAARRTAHGGA